MAIINDGGSHLCNMSLPHALKYIVKNRVATPYHLPTSAQVDVSNKEIKTILMNNLYEYTMDWSRKMGKVL